MNRIAEIVPELERAGCVLMTRPGSYFKESASGALPRGRYTETMFFDPDGVMPQRAEMGNVLMSAC